MTRAYRYAKQNKNLSLPATLKALHTFARTLSFGRPLRFARRDGRHIGRMFRLPGQAVRDEGECAQLINLRAIRWSSGIGFVGLDGYVICLVDDRMVGEYA